MIEELKIKTSKHQEVIDITKNVEDIVEKSRLKEGSCLIYVMHATASVIVNENSDPNVGVDLIETLERLIPHNGKYKHNIIDDNAASHIKASILGCNVVIPIKNNELQLGNWQDIFLVELDGPRERKVIVKILG